MQVLNKIVGCTSDRCSQDPDRSQRAVCRCVGLRRGACQSQLPWAENSGSVSGRQVAVLRPGAADDREVDVGLFSNSSQLGVRLEAAQLRAWRRRSKVVDEHAVTAALQLLGEEEPCRFSVMCVAGK